MNERERVARAVWDTLGSDYTFEESVSGSEKPTHAQAVKWVYQVADDALAAMDARPGVKDQQLHIARESLLNIAKCADDEDSQETAKNALVIMRVLDPDQ